MRELTARLDELHAQVQRIMKEGGKVSPGLKQAIDAVRSRQQTLLASMELWKGFGKAYPTYDR